MLCAGEWQAFTALHSQPSAHVPTAREVCAAAVCCCRVQAVTNLLQFIEGSVCECPHGFVIARDEM